MEMHFKNIHRMTDISYEDISTFCQKIMDTNNPKPEPKRVPSTQKSVHATLAETIGYNAETTIKQVSPLGWLDHLKFSKVYATRISDNDNEPYLTETFVIDVLSKVVSSEPTSNKWTERKTEPTYSGLQSVSGSTNVASKSTLKKTKVIAKAQISKTAESLSSVGVQCPKCPKIFEGNSLKYCLRVHIGLMHYINELQNEVKLYFKDHKCQKCNKILNVDTQKRKHLFFNHTKYVEIVMNEAKKALGEKVTERDTPNGPTKSHAKGTSKLLSPSNIVHSLESDLIDKEELFAKVEELLKSDDEETRDILDIKKKLAKPYKREQLDSEYISDDDELNESLELEEMDSTNLAEMFDSEDKSNKLNKSIENILEMNESGVKCNTKQKKTYENAEILDETTEGGDVIRSIQDHLLLMQDFSDDDEDDELEDRMQEFEDEDMLGENGTNTALDGTDLEDQVENGDYNVDKTENHQEISVDVEDSLDDIMNMELPEDDIYDTEHDGRCEEIPKDMEADKSDEEL